MHFSFSRFSMIFQAVGNPEGMSNFECTIKAIFNINQYFVPFLLPFLILPLKVLQMSSFRLK